MPDGIHSHMEIGQLAAQNLAGKHLHCWMSPFSKAKHALFITAHGRGEAAKTQIRVLWRQNAFCITHTDQYGIPQRFCQDSRAGLSVG